jgi:cell shape-determining protein MreC
MLPVTRLAQLQRENDDLKAEVANQQRYLMSIEAERDQLQRENQALRADLEEERTKFQVWAARIQADLTELGKN